MQRVEHESKNGTQIGEDRTRFVLTEICERLSIDDLEGSYQ
jgi:hypothetical protein